MSDTHPNAFRVEAQEKRAQGQQLLNEADALEAKANDLEGVEAPAEQKAPAPRKRSASRSAKNGRFVSKGKAKASPNTTETEKV